MPSSRAVIVFDGGGSQEPIVFPDLTFASRWVEPADVDEGEYEEMA